MPSKAELITALQEKVNELEDLFVDDFGEDDVEWTTEQEEIVAKIGHNIEFLQKDVLALDGSQEIED
jgi:hypothetical protein